MKLITVLLILIKLTTKISSTSEIQAISQAISDTVLKFSSNYDRKLEILILGESSSHIDDIVNKVLLNLDQIPKVIRRVDSLRRFARNLVFPTLILTKSVSNLMKLNDLNFSNDFRRRKDLKLFIYCKELTLVSVTYLPKANQLNYVKGSASEFQYFFINDRLTESVFVQTFIWFGSTFCNSPRTLTIGRFDKANLIWEQKLIDYDKYENFYNCELVFGIPTVTTTHLYYFDATSNNRKFEFLGVYPEILNCAAKRQNFHIFYQLIHIGKSNKFSLMHIPYRPSKFPHVVFEPTALSLLHNMISITTSFYETTTVFMISPGLLYTPFEKLFFPFDVETWTLLVLTFGAAFALIFVINSSSRRLMNLICGSRVGSPILNVVGSFFGIAQNHTSFVRSILSGN